MWLLAPPLLTAGEERGLGGVAGKKQALRVKGPAAPRGLGGVAGQKPPSV